MGKDISGKKKIIKVQAVQAKINTGDYSKLKSFCAAKEMMNRVKTQPTEREKNMCTLHNR